MKILNQSINDEESNLSNMKNRRDKKGAVRGRQRRNGIAEPRSGRSDGEGERKQRRSESRRNEVTERWRGGAGAHSLSRPLIM